MTDVEPTAQVIDEMATRMIVTAAALKRLAASMRQKNDLTYAAEATMEVTNLIGSIRLDLLVTRPIRALYIKP